MEIELSFGVWVHFYFDTSGANQRASGISLSLETLVKLNFSFTEGDYPLHNVSYHTTWCTELVWKRDSSVDGPRMEDNVM